MKRKIRLILLLSLPLLSFFVLVIPYQYLNSAFIVEWLGCGCPIVDEFGNMIENDFDANDFTRIFWSAITVLATVASVFLSKLIPKEKKWLRIVYVISVLVASVAVSAIFCQSMMWC